MPDLCQGQKALVYLFAETDATSPGIKSIKSFNTYLSHPQTPRMCRTHRFTFSYCGSFLPCFFRYLKETVKNRVSLVKAFKMIPDLSLVLTKWFMPISITAIYHP